MFRWRTYTPLLTFPFFFIFRKESIFIDLSPAGDALYQTMCMAISLSGEGVRMLTVGFVPSGTSGRNTKTQLATFLNSTGIYSTTRNPLYLANYLMFIGLTLMLRSWELFLINTALFAFAYYFIIRAEENYLQGQFGKDFTAFLSRVPRFFPRPWLYQKPETPFSWRMVMRREHDTVMAVVIAFALIEHLRVYVKTGEWIADPFWIYFSIGVVLADAAIKAVVKFTPLLQSPPPPEDKS